MLATPTCQSGARRPGHSKNSKKADTLGLKGTVFRVLDPLYRILIHLHVFPLFMCFRFQIWFQFHLEIFAYAKLFAVTLTQRRQIQYCHISTDSISPQNSNNPGFCITDAKLNIVLDDNYYRGIYVYQLHDQTGKIIESGKFQVSK